MIVKCSKNIKKLQKILKQTRKSILLWKDAKVLGHLIGQKSSKLHYSGADENKLSVK